MFDAIAKVLILRHLLEEIAAIEKVRVVLLQT